MKFTFDDSKLKNKFAFLPVCVSETETKSEWIWLEKYQERVVERYGICSVRYFRKSKSLEGYATGLE